MKTILVVDDIPDNIKLLKTILSDENYNVKVANSGQRCLDIVEKSDDIDLILLDIMMPNMSGIEVCQKLKQNKDTKDIPVIFVTAKGEIDDEAKGFEVGGVDYINKPVSAPIVLARVKTHLNLTQLEKYNELAREAIYMLADAGHYNDTDTGNHIWRMAAYSKALALKLGWSKDSAEELSLAATMHDTGKIGIPDSILKAPRKLTEDEWVYMRAHSRIGYEILNKSKSKVFQLSAQIALRHHEKYNGKGYPGGLKGEEIPEAARIVALADVFDALTMKRVYKEAWSVEDAFTEIKKDSGEHFDPKMVDAFVKLRDELEEIKEYWEDKD
jgi:putative two-component system response regulator